MVNMKSAASVTPKVLVSQYVPTTGAPQYQPATDEGAQLAGITLHNQDSSPRTVILAFVPSGGSAAAANEITYALTAQGTAGDRVEIGERFVGGGDFVWAQASVASKIVITITGAEFSDATGAVVAGIRTDYIGTGARGASGSLTPETCKISSLPNRRLVTSLLVQELSASAGWASYTGGQPSVSCSDGPMTRKASIDIVNAGGTVVGSVHEYIYDNPTAGSTQTITATAAASGATMNLITASKCYSGVDLTATIPVVSNAHATAALSLAFTGLAAGMVPIMAAGFVAAVPLGYNMDSVRLDGITSGFAVPQYLLFADKFGLSALTATDVNATNPYGAVGMIFQAA